MGHPIEQLMRTAMDSIRAMVDVNTVVGEAVETRDGTVIIPISRVSFGFAAGGGEYAPGGERAGAGGDRDGFGAADRERPFAGGSGAGVSVQPVGFLVVAPDGDVRLLPVTDRALYDRLIDLAADLVQHLTGRRRDGADDTGLLGDDLEAYDLAEGDGDLPRG